jgi:hypothetical protein
MLKRTFMILLLVIAVFVLFSNQEAGAVANGDGVCSGPEIANRECANFGANVIEFLGARDGMCIDSSTVEASLPCTVYYYKYTGSTTNQINVAIPLYLTKVVNDPAEINCSQFLTNGVGDPTTGFGKGFTTFGICRIAQTGTSFPPIPIPTGANFYIAADRSFFDRAEPLAWQVRYDSKTVWNSPLVGPVATVLPVEQTGATLTTSEGKSITYAVQGGGVTITQGTGSIVPMEKTKLCLPCVTGQTASFSVTSGPSAGSYCCETISYATENCDIKTTGADPCRWIGGVCIKY